MASFASSATINHRVVQRFQAALKQQSGGLLGLANLFKTFDTDNSGELSWEEFCSALQKCGLAPSPQDIRAVFLELDRDGSNSISYKEFISIMRGEMSNNRKALIKRIFETIDVDSDGLVSMSDVGRFFVPKNHPDVKSGRTTVNNLVKSFFDSLTQVTDNGFLSLTQFLEYYANSSAFDDDIKFADVMNTVWDLSSSHTTAKPSSIKSFAGNSSTIGGLLSEPDTSNNQLLEQFRDQLKSKGARGFVGLQRKFRIIDDDNSKTLNLVEFKKGVKECGLAVSELNLSQLFSIFDRDRNGVVNFDEFLVAARVSYFFNLLGIFLLSPVFRVQ
jgi:Ca2+-binding EF-hand superfamily protein